MTYAVAGSFLLANLLTLAGVAYMFHDDNANIMAKTIGPSDRVINAHVIIALVGATTVQLGALTLTMGRYLYRKA